MRIIVLGASGLIGGCLFSLARQEGKKVIGTYCRRKMTGLIRYDMRRECLQNVIPDLNKKDVVYLLSAYSNPSWIFENQNESLKLNVYFTKKLIDEVNNTGARIVFLSSVEVFDGENGNYDENAVPRPLNLYGRMKHEIEEYLAAKDVRSCIVRTGWNVGWSIDQRCVISLTYETLLRPGARMANDNILSIVDVRDTASGLIRICEDDSLKICHLASSPPILRSELASRISVVSRFGKMMNYEVVPFSEIPYTELRGRFNHLNNTLAVSRLCMKFRQPDIIIGEKVDLLDSNRIT